PARAGRGSQPARVAGAETSPQGGRTADNGGWRRLGESNARTSPESAVTPRSSDANGGGWRRFGEPVRGDSAPRGENTPRAASSARVNETPRAEQPARSQESNSGWRRFGDNGT